MATPPPVAPVVIDALETVADFIRQVTGQPATPDELADALTRYFVLNEIKDHIEMIRAGEG